MDKKSNLEQVKADAIRATLKRLRDEEDERQHQAEQAGEEFVPKFDLSRFEKKPVKKAVVEEVVEVQETKKGK